MDDEKSGDTVQCQGCGAIIIETPDTACIKCPNCGGTRMRVIAFGDEEDE